jgi:malonyl CoA-acyl carrier protein transacylase
MRQRWTDEQRKAALAAYVELGLAEAHRRTNVPKVTILRWVDACGMERNAERLAAAMHRFPEGLGTCIADIKAGMVRDLLEVAAARIAYLKATPATDPREAASTAAIAIEKAQLLAGEATARIEAITPEQAQAELDAYVREWRHAS